MVTKTAFVPPTSPSQFVASSKTLQPGKGLTVTSDDLSTATQVIDFDLTNLFASDPALVAAGIGKIADPTGAGKFIAPDVFLREIGTVGGDPNATIFAQRLTFTAPTLPDGESMQDKLDFSTFTTLLPATLVPNSNVAKTSTVIDIVTAPAIKSATANQPVAETNTVRPFSTIALKDSDFKNTATDSATITISDGGKATDTDGLLSGSGLSKTGVGTYSLADASTLNLQTTLRSLIFTTADVPTTTMASFELNVTDTKASLTGKNTDTSVMIINKGDIPIPPQIAGTAAGQTVKSGNTIQPFSTVSVSDVADAKDTAKITVTGGDANGKLSGAGLKQTDPGVYTLDAAPVGTLNAELDGIVFTPIALATGAPPITTGMSLAVTNTANNLTGTDAKTTVIEQPGGGPPIENGNFIIANQTTGEDSSQGGAPYTGPVPGIEQEIILITKDNLNITATIPNVFIHTGSGRDAIQALSGTNILDGGTGTNFLTGGTGIDTFFVDDRNPTQDIFSTIAGFNAGDSVSVFGVTKTGNTITPGDDVLPSAPGLNFGITAPGAKNANFNIPNYHVADLSNGRLSVTFGRTPDTPGLPGADFMMVHANS